MAHILLIEDDPLLAAGLAYNLEKQGHTTAQAASGAEGLAALAGAELVLLDVNLPDTDGFALAGQIRQKSGAQLIFITAHDLDEEMVRAFELGADDYITKPFNLQVALGRIGAVLRRAGAGAEAGVLRIGALEVDPARGRAGFAGMPLELTPTEYRLLLALAENRGRVVTRQQLLERLWDSDADFVDEHTLTLNVSRLRAKLGAEYIHTVRGLGYRLAEEGGA